MIAVYSCDSPSVSKCAGAACPTPCEEGASVCLGDSAAVCHDGTWFQQHCDVACTDGACVECSDGDRRCGDSVTVEVCEGARFRFEETCEAVCDRGECRCEPKASRCQEGTRVFCSADGQWRTEQCAVEGLECVEGQCVPCTPGRSRCLHGYAAEQCSSLGVLERVNCRGICDPASGRCVDPCDPSTSTLRCAVGREAVETCSDQGYWVETQACDPEDGEICREGRCLSSCALAAESGAPAGCRFFAPRFYEWKQMEGVAGRGVRTVYHLINPGTVTARVDAHFDSSVLSRAVPPKADGTFSVPTTARYGRRSYRVADDAVHISSSYPVYVVQHLVIDQLSEDPLSGDTAFLLPADLISRRGDRYRVITQAHAENHAPVPGGEEATGVQPGGFVVVADPAAGEPTLVTIDLSGTTAPSADGLFPSYPVGTTTSFALAPGESLYLLSASPSSICGTTCNYAPDGNLTGSLVRVTTGAGAAVFNTGMSRTPYCYNSECHTQTQLMEQLMPVSLWGDGPTSFAAAARSVPRENGSSAGHEQWVVVADLKDAGHSIDLGFEFPDGSTRTETLSVTRPHVSFNTADGDFAGMRNFVLSAPEPVLVARYFYTAGPTPLQSQGRAEGGSNYTLERPQYFWRNDYWFSAVEVITDSRSEPFFGYTNRNRFLVTVPIDTVVTLDGKNVDCNGSGPGMFCDRRPGPLGHDVLEATVPAGLHHVSANVPFGLLVYGYSISNHFSAGALWPQRSYTYSGPVGFNDQF